jgi:hypothetical protein
MIQWDLYSNLIHADGKTQRERTIQRSKRDIAKMVQHSPAYKEVLVDGNPQKVAIISSSTELDTKKITSMPNETINIGSIVEWNNEHWIVYDNDCEDVIYQRGMMYRCNVYLKWQNEKGEIIGRYGYISDSTKQAVGLKTSGEVMYQLEQRYKGYFPLDSETIKIRRDKRFLIDIDSFNPDAYIVTNRNVMNYNFNTKDIDENYELNTKDHLIIFMFTQTQRNEKRDNFDLMVADYDEALGKENSNYPSNTVHSEISYDGDATIKCGGSAKKFVGYIIDESGNQLDTSVKWKLITLDGEEKYFNYAVVDNTINISVEFNEKLIGTQFKLVLSDENGDYKSEVYVKVVSLYE